MEPNNSQTKLIVYAHSYCSHARSMVNALNEHSIDFEYRDVMKGDDEFKDELKALANGNLSVPTLVFPDGAVLVEPPVDEVLKLLGKESSSLLDKWLGKLKGK